MKRLIQPGFAMALSLIVTGTVLSAPAYAVENQEAAAYEEVEKGPNNGRMLRQDGFAIELAIFEDGVPPEFRVWATLNGQPLSPDEVKVRVVLDRLGDVQDKIGFYRQEDYQRGDMAIYEPHSFAVALNAEYQGKTYRWAYDNFEGRVDIKDDIAAANGIETVKAGPGTIHQTVTAYGELINPVESTRDIVARFAGVVKKVHVNLGNQVEKGDSLVTIESNQGLNAYTIKAPIDGVVSGRYVSAGEQTDGQTLLRLINNRELVAEIYVFPQDRSKVRMGSPVVLEVGGVEQPAEGVISYIGAEIIEGQGFPVRIAIDNAAGVFSPGAFVHGRITVARYDVPLSVKRDGIQAFRDFQVVYAKVGETYEVRMLEIGAQAGEWAEVLGGLEPGTEYVTSNSYVIKADIDKSGASHDH